MSDHAGLIFHFIQELIWDCLICLHLMVVYDVKEFVNHSEPDKIVHFYFLLKTKIVDGTNFFLFIIFLGLYIFYENKTFSRLLKLIHVQIN